MNDKPIKYRSVGKAITGAATTSVYTCPNNFISKVVLLFINNRINGNVVVRVEWYDASADDTYNILTAYTIGGYGYLKLDQSYLTLEAGDVLKVVTLSGAQIDVIVSVEEMYDMTQR